MKNDSVNNKRKSSSIKRIFKMLIEFYPVLVPVTAVCIVFSAIVSVLPAIFTQKIYAILDNKNNLGKWDYVFDKIFPLIITLIVVYVI